MPSVFGHEKRSRIFIGVVIPFYDCAFYLLSGKKLFLLEDKLKYKRDDCIRLLKDKQLELTKKGSGRYPKRSDFGDEEVVAIKAFLGPWPRALEAAGLKPERESKKRLK